MAYMIDAGNLLLQFTGHDLYRRVFFQHTGSFPLYTKARTPRAAVSATTPRWAICRA